MTKLKMLLRWVVLLAVIHLGCVGADYIFEAQLESYQNPTHSLQNGDCCDGDQNTMGVCTDPCDNVFTFCVKESTDTGSNLAPPFCPFLRDVSGVFQDNDDISFGEDLGNGVSNPLTFNRSGAWPGGVRFAARSRDSNATAGPIIATLFAIINISAGSDFTTVNATGPMALMATMTVSFRVMCTGNFMGPDCSMCREGFTGGSCDIDLDPCVPTSPCQNGGTCMSPGQGQFECRCVEGYEGMNCELMTDECDPNPCQNGGTCVDLFLDYECNCAAGHEGRNCSRETDECVPNPCMNGGTCMDLPLDYECDCAAGYEGRNCSRETDECVPNPCMNGGICMDLLADYSCSCVSGFTGRNCEMVEEEDGSVSVGVIGGAVAAGVLVLVIVVLVLVLVKLLMKTPRRNKVVIAAPGTTVPAETLKGDNPGGVGKTDTQNTNTGSSVYHDFENPLYNGPVDREYDTPANKAPDTPPQAMYSKPGEHGAPPTHDYDYVTNETTPPKAPTGPSVTYDYADTPKPPELLPVYDSTDDPTTELPLHTYSHPHTPNNIPPIHEYDYAGTGQPVYATPGGPPVVNEHDKVMPTHVGPSDASKALDPTEHYDFGPDF